MSTRELLEEIVRLAYGTEAEARRVIAEALRAAHAVEVPALGEELRAFVRAHAMPLVIRDHGAMLASAVMEELDVALAELAVQTSMSTAPPPSGTSRARLVLVIHPAGHRDLGLEDQLTSANFRVLVKEGPLNLGPAKASPYHGVVAVIEDPSVLAELKEQAEAFGYLGAVVICADRHPDADAVARELGAVRLLPREASAEQIVTCVKELLW